MSNSSLEKVLDCNSCLIEELRKSEKGWYTNPISANDIEAVSKTNILSMLDITYTRSGLRDF